MGINYSLSSKDKTTNCDVEEDFIIIQYDEYNIIKLKNNNDDDIIVHDIKNIDDISSLQNKRKKKKNKNNKF